MSRHSCPAGPAPCDLLRGAARFKECYGTSGAKSDKGDAHALADMVRVDGGQLRPVAGDSDQAQAVHDHEVQGIPGVRTHIRRSHRIDLTLAGTDARIALTGITDTRPLAERLVAVAREPGIDALWNLDRLHPREHAALAFYDESAPWLGSALLRRIALFHTTTRHTASRCGTGDTGRGWWRWSSSGRLRWTTSRSLPPSPIPTVAWT